mgnify:CR=1 FL=1
MKKKPKKIKKNKKHKRPKKASKSKSLKGVMDPFSSSANFDMLKRAGFKDIMTVLKFVNFEGFLAIK